MVSTSPSERANIGLGICRSVTGLPSTITSTVIAACSELPLRLLMRWCFIAYPRFDVLSVPDHRPRAALSFLRSVCFPVSSHTGAHLFLNDVVEKLRLLKRRLFKKVQDADFFRLLA